ncbi:branched-chain amino acid ABC transporter permease [Halobacteriales archaeon SW_7_71_33]|nr:MAG: branched-chain amino acid ABC transporter permease [Halobacteriales archaeon SW_7_71_33]
MSVTVGLTETAVALQASPELVVQQLLNGLSIGAVYALIAIGLTLVFGIMDVINFAHGEFVMLGGYALFWLITLFSVPFFPAMVVGVILVGGFAVVVERSVFRPLYDRPLLAPMMASFGLLLVVQNGVSYLWGGRPRSIPDPFGNAVLSVEGFTVSYLRLFTVVVTALMYLGLWAFLQYSVTGKAVRATAQNEEAALIRGIDTDRVNTVTFVLSGVFGAVGGVLYGTLFPVFPTMGLYPMLKAFAAIIIGGLGSVPGALVGGLLIGVVEAVGIVLVENGSQWRDAFAFLLLVVVLLVRPRGLLGGWDR